MITMVNMTTRRTDRDVLSVLKETVVNDEAIAIHQIAALLDCERKTIIRSISRLERLNRIEIDRTVRPSRYKVIE